MIKSNCSSTRTGIRTVLFAICFLSLAMIFLGIFELDSQTAQAETTSEMQVVSENNEHSNTGNAEADRDIAAGVRMADSMNRTLGTGLSPIFGLGAMGVYDYMSLPENKRLWYANPIFFLPVLLVLAGIVTKDVLGVPLGPVKQTFDALEVLVNKAGGFLGLIAVMSYTGIKLGPEFTEVAMVLYEVAIPTAHAAQDTVQTTGAFESIGAFLASVFAGISYCAVWLTGQTYTIIMFLNPFSPLDPILKGFRASIMSFITLITAVSPIVGLLICLFYFLMAYLVSGFCIRLCSYGALLSWETLCKRGKGNVEDEKGILSFSSKAFKGVPNRTLGYLRKEESHIVFQYKPWLVLKQKEIEIDSKRFRGVSKGLIYSSIYVCTSDEKKQDVFHLPPRWIGTEEEIKNIFDIPELTESTLKGGIKSGIAFVKSFFQKDVPAV